jgi:hypothetical protein
MMSCTCFWAYIFSEKKSMFNKHCREKWNVFHVQYAFATCLLALEVIESKRCYANVSQIVYSTVNLEFMEISCLQNNLNKA